MEKYNIRLLSDEQLTALRENLTPEMARRAEINDMVDQINKLLYKLYGQLNGYEYLSFTHNQLSRELFNTKDIEEPENAEGWFAPQIMIEREE